MLEMIPRFAAGTCMCHNKNFRPSKSSFFGAQFIIGCGYICTEYYVRITLNLSEWWLQALDWVRLNKFSKLVQLHHSMPCGFRNKFVSLSLWYYCGGIWNPWSWFVGDALISFRTAILSSDGVLLQWRPEDPDPCGWKGVQCDPKTQRVISLWVWSHNGLDPLDENFWLFAVVYAFINLQNKKFDLLLSYIAHYDFGVAITLSSNIYYYVYEEKVTRLWVFPLAFDDYEIYQLL